MRCSPPGTRFPRSPRRASLLTLGLLAACAGLELVASAPLHAQEEGEPRPGSVSITGTVVDRETGEPVEGATVRLLPDGPDAVTNARGDFRFRDIRPGAHELEIHHVAYGTALIPASVQQGESLHLRLQLEAKAVEVAPLQVTVERERRSEYLADHDFYDRLERDFGQFWTPAELERRNPLRVSHVLQETSGVKLVRQCGTGRCIHLPRMTASTPRFTPDGSLVNCTATVYLDGHKVKLGGGMGIDDLVPASSLAAVEVYRGASATAPRFVDSGSRCGVVVLWTKHGPDPSPVQDR